MFGDGPSEQINRGLPSKKTELDQTIKQLNALKNGLKHAAIGPEECPSFGGC